MNCDSLKTCVKMPYWLCEGIFECCEEDCSICTACFCCPWYFVKDNWPSSEEALPAYTLQKPMDR